MICPNCQIPLPDDARFCCACGGSVTAFEPPDGFEIDPESLRFYRDDGTSADGAERYYTWFDPNTGAYEQGSYPVEQQESVQEAVAEPEPEPEPQPEPKPYIPEEELRAEIPEGFTLDPSSGLYYLATPGRDRSNGEAGQWYTWYYPDSGKYEQVFYPSDPAPQGSRQQNRQPQRDTAARTDHSTASVGEKRKVSAVLLALPLIALIGGGIFAFAQGGGLSMLTGAAKTELPEGIEMVTVDAADMPRFVQPGDSEEANGSTGEEDVPGEESDRESESINPEGVQTARANGVEMNMKYTFYSGEDVVVQLNGVTEDLLASGALVALYRAGDGNIGYLDVQLLSGGDSYYGFGRYSPGEYEIRVFSSEQAFYDAAAPMMMLPFTVTGADGDNREESGTEGSGEASGYNWATLYADYLWDQGFAYQEFLFYGDMATFPVYSSPETTLAVMLVTFYDVEGFDTPVMELLAMAEMEGEPGVLDTSPYRDLYIIRYGEVTRELTSAENGLIVSYDENTGMDSIRGSLITTYELYAPAAGETGSAMVDDNFAYLYDWLAYEAQRTSPARAESPASEPPAESPASEAASEAPMMEVEPEMSAEQ